jgi:hypothetical protein
MLQAVLSPPNAILFVFDPTNQDAIVPPYIDGELAAASSTCISVGTQADVDGEVEVSLGLSSERPENLHLVFGGSIQAPGGCVGIVTAKFQRVLELEVPPGSLEVSIWADDSRNPAHVAVRVKPA